MPVSQSLKLTQTSQNVSGNTSQVRIQWTSTQSGDSFNNYTRKAKYYVSINGGAETEYTVSYSLPKGKTTTIVDTTIAVPHRTDGTGTIAVRTWMDTNISAGVITKNSTLALDDIPRATTPTFYEQTVEMGRTATIYVYGASTGFLHDIYYSFEGGPNIPIAKDVYSAYYWAVPDLADQIPNKSSGVMTIRVITKLGRDGEQIGSAKSNTFTVTVPSTEEYLPTVSVSLTEATEDVAAQFGAFVKSKSAVACEVNAAGKKGATITDIIVQLDGRIYTEASFTSEVLTTAGELPVVVQVTDSRGKAVSYPTTINVLDYFVPEVREFKAYRTDEDGLPDPNGKYLAVAYDYEAAPVGDKNTAVMTVSYRRSDGSTSWKTLQRSTSLIGSGVVKYDEEITTDYQLDVKLAVVDWFEEEGAYTVILPTAEVILDFKANGKGVAAGKTSEYDGFEVDMPANGESMKLIGVRNYATGDAYGHILYNNGLLLQWGTVVMTAAQVNVTSSLQVAFPYPYRERPHITATLLSSAPQEARWALGVGGSEQAARSSLTIYLNRTVQSSTSFRWLAIGLADLTKLPEVTDV